VDTGLLFAALLGIVANTLSVYVAYRILTGDTGKVVNPCHDTCIAPIELESEYVVAVFIFRPRAFLNFAE
jgi:hypothetical protein